MPCPFTGPKMFWAGLNFCVRPKIYLHIIAVTKILCKTKKLFAFSKINFCACTKVFEEALNAVKFFGVAQKIWIGTNYFGTCKGQDIYFYHRSSEPTKIGLIFRK